MDTRKEYIDMCEKVTELQKHKQHYMVGDVYCSKMFCDIVTVGDVKYENRRRGDEVWLPRQDQLQEMILAKMSHTDPVSELFDYFNAFRSRDVKIHCADRPSYMSQLYMEVKSFDEMWLRFYMWSQHSKLWNEEKKKWEVKVH